VILIEPAWLQKGQSNLLMTLGLSFLGGGLDDFLFPMVFFSLFFCSQNFAAARTELYRQSKPTRQRSAATYLLVEPRKWWKALETAAKRTFFSRARFFFRGVGPSGKNQLQQEPSRTAHADRVKTTRTQLRMGVYVKAELHTL
jgi:hypothetical protein